MAAKSSGNKPVVDLAKLFGAVANSLADNKDQLNQADTYNNDHGDNMVQTFSTIAKVVGGLKGKSQSTQLAKAAKELQKSKSGSAKLYAEGLQQASQQFKGKSITPDSAGMLLQALMGAQAPAAAPASQPVSQGSDLLGSLLGALGSNKETPASNQPASQGGDLLGSLMGALGSSSQDQNQADNGFDLGDLLNAGMSFMNSKQQGSSTTEAAINALLSASPLGQSTHRTQSGTVVANTIMQVLAGLTNK
jgi:hypothetical protein